MATITPNLGLTLPAEHDQNWGVPTLNADFTLIDTFAGTTVLLSPPASQTIAQVGGTFLNINAALLYGSLPILRFGDLVNVWDTSLSRPAAGILSFDANTPGDGLGTAQALNFNAFSGFQFNGAAPLNHLLVGDGTHYVDSATLPSGLVNYQTVEQSGTPLTPRSKLNFLSPLTAVDDSGNGSSDIGLANTAVAPGTYTNVTLTVDQQGRVTAAANGGGVTATPSGDLGPSGANTRAISGVYQNTSLSPIWVEGYIITNNGTQVGNYAIERGPTSGLGSTPFAQEVTATQAGGNGAFIALIPAGYFYTLIATGSAGIVLGKWYETSLS